MVLGRGERCVAYMVTFQNKGHAPGTQISKLSDEHVLDLLSTSEEKLLKLLEELDGQDLSDLLNEMEEQEV